MKLKSVKHVLVLVSLLPAVSYASEHGHARRHHALAMHRRQDPPSLPPPQPTPPPADPAPPPGPSPPPAPPPPPPPPGPPAPDTTPPPQPLPPSTLPTAVTPTFTGPPPLDTGTTIPPLANITSGMPTKALYPFTNTFTPGATPPVQGAPVLPTALVLSGWPETDKVPSTDSPEVAAWMKELQGKTIPDIAPTVDGSCVGDPAAAAAAAQRGWWTCGGYTRDTDIVSCPTKNTWGVSFDDGPSPHSPILLDYLEEKNIKSTFFVVGSRVISYPGILIDEYMSGHEISVHTWSHRPLTSLTTEQVVAELGWTRKAIKTVLGVTPTTMRPPYGDIDDRVRAISLAMGLVPIMWTTTPSGNKFDTNDWRVAGGIVNGTASFDTFQKILADASLLDTGFIVLQHDLFEITVNLAAGYFLDAALNHNPKFTLEPIGKCVGIPTTNLYLETNKNASFPVHNGPGVDISGDGKPDTKSGDGGVLDDATGGALANAVSILGTSAAAGLAIFALWG